MKFFRHSNFDKEYRKLPKKIRVKTEERLEIFDDDHMASVLNNHELHGEYSNHRSINITGDYRAIYYLRGDTAIFIRIGTHPELYS